MTPDDLARIHASAFKVPRPWSADEIATLLSSPFCFVITEDHGFILGRVVADEAELLTIAVEPNVQRQGIGRHLMERFLAELHSRKASQVFLEVAADNDAAIALYRASGFTQQGLRRGYYIQPNGQAVDAIIMRHTFAQTNPA